jgi:nucleoside phosphorylase
MKLLVVAAWDPELVRFRALASERPAGLVIRPIGVGLVEAAVGMARALADEAPDAAFFVGTCGVFGAARTGEVVAPREARLVVPEVSARRAALPGPMPTLTCASAALHDGVVRAGARSVSAACTVAITIDDALAGALSSEGDVEHLELFAFGRACDASAVPWGAALGVANAVGAKGRDAWRENHELSSARAAEIAWEAMVRTSTTGRSPERA